MSKKSEFSEWSKLIEKNIDWWFNTHDKEHYLEVNYYTVEEILDENKNSIKLKELNKFVITIDSQDETSDAVGCICHPDFIKSIGRKDLKDVLCRESQRPYVELLCTKEQVLKISSIKDEKIGYLYYYYNPKHGFKMKNNSVLKNMLSGGKFVNLTKDVFDNGVVINLTNINLLYYCEHAESMIIDRLDKSLHEKVVLMTVVYNQYGPNESGYSTTDYMLNLLIETLK